MIADVLPLEIFEILLNFVKKMLYHAKTKQRSGGCLSFRD